MFNWAQSGRDQMAALNAQGKVSLAQTKHFIPKNEIDKKPTQFLFDLCKQSNSRTNERKAIFDQPSPNFWLISKAI